MSLSSFFHTSRKTLTTAMLVVFLVLGSIPFGALTAQAAEAFEGELVARSHRSIKIKPGGALTFTIKFKNTGTSTWKNNGANFVAIATTPNLRTSEYQHAFWEAPYRAGRLVEPQVAPGGVGTFRFALQAPEAVGEYTEEFQAVARNLSWVEGTDFAIELEVTTEVSKPAPVTTTPEPKPVESKPATISVDYPVNDPGYKAEFMAGDVQSYTLKPEAQVFGIFEVKNTGTKTWKNTGPAYVSLYTVRPNYHASPFYSNGPGWVSNSQIRLASESVAPGEVGKFVVMLQAPKASGSYTEYIRLAAEDRTWVSGGEMAITITVPQQHTIISKPVETGPVNNTLYRDTEYQASFTSLSEQSISLAPGASVHVQVGFKNTGQKTWKREGARFTSLYTIEPNYRNSRFSAAGTNSGWLSASQIALQEAQVNPGQIGYFSFTLTAPTTPGAYTEKFRLAAEDWSWIQGGEIALPITVLGDASSPTENPELGPTMRVGLYHSTEPFEITADSPFEVRTGSGEVVASLPARTPVTVEYSQATNFYTVKASGLNRSLPDSIIIHAIDSETISEILSLDKPVPWNKAINENVFRGSIEIKHSTATGQTWAINILPMEHYLRGIAETSSSSPVEFLKVMSVAARTYATYHYERQTKHANKHFYVDSEFDQVYRGYSLEQRHPSLTEAVLATTGEIITHTNPTTQEKKLAITPYFSQSDGRTRDWSEVWGGEVAWCKSVPVPHDAGRPLLGHGVGMSARGGLLMVAEDGLNYSQVLNYFFAGIVIEDRY